MIERVNGYFKDKKIKAQVLAEYKSDNFVTYYIYLQDIQQLKKFNNNMARELSFVLKREVSVIVDDDIRILFNNVEIQQDKISGLTLDIGRDTKGEQVFVSFKNNPHWLVGGSTGSGKSVFINNLVHQLLERYADSVEFGFIDLKQVEFYNYNNLCMNVCDVANDIESAINLLNGAIDIMNERYDRYKRHGVLDIDSYNEIAEVGDKYFFIIIDELAELVLQNKKVIHGLLQRLLQLGRASGVYLICATQRPSADVISGVLKVNFTTRVCFRVTNAYDSRTILNQKGAELLTGNGDGYLLKNGSFKLTRFQGYPPTKDDTIVQTYKRQTYDFLKGLKKALKGTWWIIQTFGYIMYILLMICFNVLILLVRFLLFLVYIFKRR